MHYDALDPGEDPMTNFTDRAEKNLDPTLVNRAENASLASLLLSYPDDEFLANVGEFSPTLREHSDFSALLALLDSEGLDSLRAVWLDRFDVGPSKVSMYETEYGRMRGLAKGNDLADLAGFYHAFGLEIDESAHETHDFLPVELEFLALLLAKEAYLEHHGDTEGVSIVQGARRSFLTDHLGPLAPAIARRISEDPIYGPVLAWVASFIASECRSLGVISEPLEYVFDEDSRRAVRCGSLPVLQ